MDLLTWTRKGKDSNIYYIYIYIYILIGMLPKSQKSGEFVGTFCYCCCFCYYYYCCYCLCVCVLPLQTVCCCWYDKKNRLLEHNTYLTLPYLTHLFLSDSDKIYRDSSSIHRLVSRKNDYSGRQKKVPLGTNFKLARELIGIDYRSIQFSKYSRRALEKTFTLVLVVVVVIVTIRKQREPNQTKQNISIFKEEVQFFLRSTTCLSCTNTKINQSIQDKKKRRRRQNNNNNIKTMTHHHMGFTPSSSSSTSSSSSSTTTTKPSATTTKKSLQRACLGGMVITPCEKCTIRTYVSLSSLSHPIHHHFNPYPYPIPLLLLPFPSSDCIEYHVPDEKKSYLMLKTKFLFYRTSKCRNCNGNMFVRNTARNCPGCGLCGGGGGYLDGDDGNGNGDDDGDDQSKSRGRKDSGVGL